MTILRRTDIARRAKKKPPEGGLSIQTPVIVNQIAVNAGFDSRRRSRAGRCQILIDWFISSGAR
jgi:hypothetical protein